MEFPHKFIECPDCHCEETVYSEAGKDDVSAPKYIRMMLRKEMSPIQDFLSISTPTTKVLIRYYDTCAICGKDRCVLAEKGVMPTDVIFAMLGGKMQGPG